MTMTSPLPATRKVVVNFMEGGGHFDWGQQINAEAWRESFNSVIDKLKKEGWDIVFIAHDLKEANIAKKYWPTFACVLADSMKEYFDVVRDAAFGVFNRMHASVAAAGLGIPSVAIGTDARNLMVSQLGLPAIFVKNATSEMLNETVFDIVKNRDSYSRKLLDLRRTTFDRYVELLTPIFKNLD
jgi:polysaccharide pyruvyl transferase WcaK-like protein